MQKRKMSAERGAPRLAAHALAGMVSGLASAFILFGLVAAVCCKVDIPPHLLLPLSTVAVSFAMLPAGLVFAALHGEKGMLYGLLMGAMFFVALWIAALAQGQTEFTSLSAVKGVAMMSAGAIGGYLGIALRERRRCCFSERMRKLFRKNEKSVLRFCNKSSKTKRAFTKVLMPCKRPF